MDPELEKLRLRVQLQEKMDEAAEMGRLWQHVMG